MKHPVLLRAVNKARHSRSAAATTKSTKRRKRTTRGQRGPSKPAHSIPVLFPDLFAGVDQAIMASVEAHLKSPSPSDVMMLDAWERVGRQDAHRGQRVSYKHSAAQTMTPLGLACLARYARGFEDENAAVLAGL